MALRNEWSKWSVWWTARDEEFRRNAVGGELLEKMPELKTKNEIRWEEEGVGKNFRILCELLKRNAIPAKIMNLNGYKMLQL